MRMLAAGVFVVASVGLAGCGGSGDDAKGQKLDDGKQLAALITEFADTGSPATMLGYFVKGSPKISPADHKKYVAMTYAFDGSPSVNGTAATGKVKMKSASDEKEIGSREWEFAKEGEKWKIKSAPMP